MPSPEYQEATMRKHFFQHRELGLSAAVLALLPAIVLAGCGGGAKTTAPASPPSSSSGATTAVQVNMGDSPADWMLAFSMNIQSMSLTGGSGSAAVVSSSTPVEMMHLMGTMQPLAMISAPQGTYTGASITISSATVMYMDPSTKAPVQATIPGPVNVTVPFGSPLVVGSTPLAMGFDLDLASSVTSGSGGALAFQPVFHMTSGMQGSGNPADWANGGIERMVGAVSAVSGSSFTVTCLQASQSFTFQTNSSTSFSGMTMGTMSSGMLVMVDAELQADGSLLATDVRKVMGSGGVMAGGIITAMTGQPPTALTLVMQNGSGAGMMGSFFASGATVNLSSGTTFAMDQDQMDMTGLPFTPAFDASHIYVGQTVMPVSTGGMMGGSGGGMGGGMMGGGPQAGTINASGLQLEPQGLTGTTGSNVASGSTSAFTLTLPAGSAFTTLTGATAVTVYPQSHMIVAGTSPIASGTSVHVFGLLFFNNGQWKMVASRMGAL
jgi:hypothetical protein